MQEEKIECGECGKDVTELDHVMCDQTGVWCYDCWAQVKYLCLFVHGEGCSTKVFYQENSNAPL